MLIYTQDDKKPVKNQIGGKAFSLAQMQKLNINIPKWFVLTSNESSQNHKNHRSD